MNTDWFRLAESYTMHLDFSYCKTCDWMLSIYKRGCGKDGEDLIIFNDQDCDPTLLLAKGEIALKEWLWKNYGGY